MSGEAEGSKPVQARRRPRPAVKRTVAVTQTVEVKEVQVEVGTVNVKGKGKAKELPKDDDEEIFFNRRKQLVMKQGAEKAKAKLAQTLARLEESDDESQGGSGSSEASEDERGGRKRKRKTKHPELPSWTKGGVITIEDSDDEDFGKHSEDEGKTDDDQASPKKVAKPNRARSLTPPPAVNPAHIQNALQIMKNALAQDDVGRAYDVLMDHEELHTKEAILDPELERIKEQVRRRAVARTTDSLESGGQGTSGDADVDDGLTVNIIVKMVAHPTSTSVKARQFYEAPISIMLNSRETFDTVFNTVSHMRGVTRDNLILTHADARVYPSSTPKGLRIFGSANLNGYSHDVWYYIEEQKMYKLHGITTPQDPPAVTNPVAPSPSPSGPSVPPYSGSPMQQQQAPQAPSAPETAKLRITIRAGRDKEIKLAVSKTTTVGTILKKFLQLTGEPESKFPQVRLEYDGEKLSNDDRIGDTDVEDDDLLDVVGS